MVIGDSRTGAVAKFQGLHNFVAAGLRNSLPLLPLNPGQSCGLDAIPPRLANPGTIDRLIRPVFIAPLPAVQRRRFDDMLVLTALFGAPHPFESTLTRMPGVRAATTAELKDALAASVRYIVRSSSIAPQRLEVCA